MISLTVELTKYELIDFYYIYALSIFAIKIE